MAPTRVGPQYTEDYDTKQAPRAPAPARRPAPARKPLPRKPAPRQRYTDMKDQQVQARRPPGPSQAAVEAQRQRMIAPYEAGAARAQQQRGRVAQPLDDLISTSTRQRIDQAAQQQLVMQRQAAAQQAAAQRAANDQRAQRVRRSQLDATAARLQEREDRELYGGLALKQGLDPNQRVQAHSQRIPAWRAFRGDADDIDRSSRTQLVPNLQHYALGEGTYDLLAGKVGQARRAMGSNVPDWQTDPNFPHLSRVWAGTAPRQHRAPMQPGATQLEIERRYAAARQNPDLTTLDRTRAGQSALPLGRSIGRDLLNPINAVPMALGGAGAALGGRTGAALRGLGRAGEVAQFAADPLGNAAAAGAINLLGRTAGAVGRRVGSAFDQAYMQPFEDRALAGITPPRIPRPEVDVEVDHIPFSTIRSPRERPAWMNDDATTALRSTPDGQAGKYRSVPPSDPTAASVLGPDEPEISGALDQRRDDWNRQQLPARQFPEAFTDPYTGARVDPGDITGRIPAPRAPRFDTGDAWTENAQALRQVHDDIGQRLDGAWDDMQAQLDAQGVPLDARRDMRGPIYDSYFNRRLAEVQEIFDSPSDMGFDAWGKEQRAQAELLALYNELRSAGRAESPQEVWSLLQQAEGVRWPSRKDYYGSQVYPEGETTDNLNNLWSDMYSTDGQAQSNIDDALAAGDPWATRLQAALDMQQQLGEFQDQIGRAGPIDPDLRERLAVAEQAVDPNLIDEQYNLQNQEPYGGGFPEAMGLAEQRPDADPFLDTYMSREQQQYMQEQRPQIQARERARAAERARNLPLKPGERPAQQWSTQTAEQRAALLREFGDELDQHVRVDPESGRWLTGDEGIARLYEEVEADYDAAPPRFPNIDSDLGVRPPDAMTRIDPAELGQRRAAFAERYPNVFDARAGRFTDPFINRFAQLTPAERRAAAQKASDAGVGGLLLNQIGYRASSKLAVRPGTTGENPLNYSTWPDAYADVLTGIASREDGLAQVLPAEFSPGQLNAVIYNLEEAAQSGTLPALEQKRLLDQAYNLRAVREQWDSLDSPRLGLTDLPFDVLSGSRPVLDDVKERMLASDDPLVRQAQEIRRALSNDEQSLLNDLNTGINPLPAIRTIRDRLRPPVPDAPESSMAGVPRIVFDGGTTLDVRDWRELGSVGQQRMLANRHAWFDDGRGVVEHLDPKAATGGGGRRMGGVTVGGGIIGTGLAAAGLYSAYLTRDLMARNLADDAEWRRFMEEQQVEEERENKTQREFYGGLQDQKEEANERLQQRMDQSDLLKEQNSTQIAADQAARRWVDDTRQIYTDYDTGEQLWLLADPTVIQEIFRQNGDDLTQAQKLAEQYVDQQIINNSPEESVLVERRDGQQQLEEMLRVQKQEQSNYEITDEYKAWTAALIADQRKANAEYDRWWIEKLTPDEKQREKIARAWGVDWIEVLNETRDWNFDAADEHFGGAADTSFDGEITGEINLGAPKPINPTAPAAPGRSAPPAARSSAGPAPSKYKPAKPTAAARGGQRPVVPARYNNGVPRPAPNPVTGEWGYVDDGGNWRASPPAGSSSRGRMAPAAPAAPPTPKPGRWPGPGAYYGQYAVDPMRGEFVVWDGKQWLDAQEPDTTRAPAEPDLDAAQSEYAATLQEQLAQQGYGATQQARELLEIGAAADMLYHRGADQAVVSQLYDQEIALAAELLDDPNAAEWLMANDPRLYAKAAAARGLSQGQIGGGLDLDRLIGMYAGTSTGASLSAPADSSVWESSSWSSGDGGGSRAPRIEAWSDVPSQSRTILTRAVQGMMDWNDPAIVEALRSMGLTRKQVMDLWVATPRWTTEPNQPALSRYV